MKVRYAIMVTSDKAVSDAGMPGAVVTEKGDRFWVCIEPEGWVEATSSRVGDPMDIPVDAMTFITEAAAEHFAKKWTGHPWWCKPIEHEIIPVLPKFRQVHSGWGRTSRR